MKSLVIFLSIIWVTSARKLPSFIEVCKPKHTDVSECIARNIEILRPKFAEGIPELLIPKLQPIKIPFAQLDLGNLNATIKNTEAWLPKSFKVEQVKLDLDNFHLTLKVIIPEVKVTTDYNVKGKILVLTLDGSGKGTIILNDLVVLVDARGTIVTRKGKEYIQPTKIDLKPKAKSVYIDLENLFANNPELTAQTNKILNENQEVILKDFSPIVLNFIQDVINNYMHNFFGSFRYNDLFPKD